MRDAPIYDQIGHGYALGRTTDPRWAAAIRAAIGPAKSVVNVGAGTGSYEPADVDVVAVEPSAVMIRQRLPTAAPTVRASAESLPFNDQSFDVAMAVLTIHHWTDWRQGVAELRRVSRRQVLLTFDADVHSQFWLVADYLPEAGQFDRERTPSMVELSQALGGADIAPLRVPADMEDAVLAAHWNRPEAYLDEVVRRSASTFAQNPADIIARALTNLERDLADGTWDRRHGHLRAQESHEAGYRLVTSGACGLIPWALHDEQSGDPVAA